MTYISFFYYREKIEIGLQEFDHYEVYDTEKCYHQLGSRTQ